MKHNQLHTAAISPCEFARALSSLALSVILLTALLSALGTPTLAFAAPRVEGPEIIMELTRRDFGDVFSGEELEQIFPVRNAGTRPLELSQKSSLGTRPTAPRLLQAAWRPGESRFASAALSRPAPS